VRIRLLIAQKKNFIDLFVDGQLQDNLFTLNWKHADMKLKEEKINKNHTLTTTGFNFLGFA